MLIHNVIIRDFSNYVKYYLLFLTFVGQENSFLSDLDLKSVICHQGSHRLDDLYGLVVGLMERWC